MCTLTQVPTPAEASHNTHVALSDPATAHAILKVDAVSGAVKANVVEEHIAWREGLVVGGRLFVPDTVCGKSSARSEMCPKRGEAAGRVSRIGTKLKSTGESYSQLAKTLWLTRLFVGSRTPLSLAAPALALIASPSLPSIIAAPVLPCTATPFVPNH